MKIKNAIFSTAVTLLMTVSLFASTPNYPEVKTTSKAVKEISTLIQDINFDVATLQDQTVKVQFMINSDDELIILQTNNASVDYKIKDNLNYAKLKENDLEVNKIYIIPVSFKSELTTG